jgi:GAF domain-containing protein
MSATNADLLLADVTQILTSPSTGSERMSRVLARVLDGLGCVAGTIHRFNPASGLLEIVAHRGIPEAVLNRAARVPIGKGMAGLAAERQEAVQVCNLQTDNSGVAQPAARETPVEGAIAVPLLVDGALRGTLGVAKAAAYEFPPAEIELLLRLGELIGQSICEGNSPP